VAFILSVVAAKACCLFLPRSSNIYIALPDIFLSRFSCLLPTTLTIRSFFFSAYVAVCVQSTVPIGTFTLTVLVLMHKHVVFSHLSSLRNMKID
jgi:hypothetical protein